MPASMLQLDPAIPVMAQYHDDTWHKAVAHGWLDYGIDDDLYFVCLLDNGEWWILSNKHVRGRANITIGRRVTLPPAKQAAP
jgi:hypothetical protein